MITHQRESEDLEVAAKALSKAREGCIRLLWQIANLLIEHGCSLSTAEVATLDLALMRMMMRADHWTLALLGNLLAQRPQAAPRATHWLAQRKQGHDSSVTPGWSTPVENGFPAISWLEDGHRLAAVR